MHIKIPQMALDTADDQTAQPERKLIVAVITQALRDLTDAKHREGARAFIQSDEFSHFCDLLELQTTTIREKVL